jgi:hypothetical protein
VNKAGNGELFGRPDLIHTQIPIAYNLLESLFYYEQKMIIKMRKDFNFIKMEGKCYE